MEASRLQTPALILLALLAAWLLSVIPFRRHRWAVAGWLPATGLAAVGTLAIFFVVLEFIHLTGVGGAAAGFAAIGLARILPVFLLAPLFLGLSLYLKPPEPQSDAAILLAALVFSGLVMRLLFAVQGEG